MKIKLLNTGLIWYKPNLLLHLQKLMNWEQLLSLQRFGDTTKRIRKEQDEIRLGFEVDYDRIVFSSFFRSLQDKTQVIPFSKTDFVHTRLTHSIEVSVVARSLGRLAGKAILERHPHLQQVHGYQANDFGAIVAAAALGHDIGNPPFGHSGEKAIGHYFSTGEGKAYKDQLSAVEYEDLCRFEGNANGFKLLTETVAGAPGGLRISYATLGAYMKYPKSSLPYRPTLTWPTKVWLLPIPKGFLNPWPTIWGLKKATVFIVTPWRIWLKQQMIFVILLLILKTESTWAGLQKIMPRIFD